jgi:hypothetical protein
MKVQPADPWSKPLRGCEWASIASPDAFCSRYAAVGALRQRRPSAVAICNGSPSRHLPAVSPQDAFIGSLLEGCTRGGIEDAHPRFGLFGFIETDLIL